jgi:hypothetical protein
MNWDAVAAAGELTAAVGVVVSLIYLATQVRHATATARRAAGHEIMTTINPLLTSLATHPDVASIWARGLADYNALEPAEQIRFSCLMLTLTYTWDEAMHASEIGQLDAWAAERFMGTVNEFAHLPGFKAWYAIRNAFLSRDLRALLESKFASTAERSAMYQRG